MMMTPRAKSRERVQLDSRHADITAAHEDHAERIQIADIRTDGGTQMRAAIDKSVVREYANLMADGHVFPPIVVYHDGTNYWLADGFHRLRAWELYHQDKGKPVESIACDVKSGDRRRAILHAVKANAEHGLRRTNADKRRAVETLLMDDEWRRWSDREVARACGVSHATVGAIRKRLEGTGQIVQLTGRQTADGRVMEISGIGAANVERAQSQRREVKPIRDTRPREPVSPAPPTYTQEPPQSQPPDEPARRGAENVARLHRLRDQCRMMLDEFAPEFEDVTGNFDTGHELRKILRQAEAAIDRHLVAYEKTTE